MKDTPVSRSPPKSRSRTRTPTSENNYLSWKNLQPFVMLVDKKESKDLVSESTTPAIAATTNPTDPAVLRLSSKEVFVTTTAEETSTGRRNLARAGITTTTASTDTATENTAQSTATKRERTENAAEPQKSRQKSTFGKPGTAHRRGDQPGQKMARKHAVSSIVTLLTTL
jgi:hypothetical protein